MARFTHSLASKLLLQLVLLIIVAMGLFTWFLLDHNLKQIRDFRQQQAVNQAATLARGGVDSLITRDYHLLEPLVAAAMPSADYLYAYVSSTEGQVLVHSDYSLTAQKIEAGTQVRNQGDLMIREGEHQGIKLIEIIQPMRLGQELVGYAHVGYQESPTKDLFSLTRLPVLQSAVLLLAAMLLGVIAITRMVVAPIKELTHAISRTKLHKDANIPDSILGSRDEIGYMAQTFAKLHGRSHQLFRQLNDEQQRLTQTVHQLDEETERLQVTLASIGDAVFTTDRDGIVQFINPAAERLTGIEDADTHGKHVLQIVHLVDEDTRRLRKLVTENCIKNKTSYHFSELKMRRPDGSQADIEIIASPIMDHDKQVFGVITVIRDETERKKLEQRLTYQATHDTLTGLANREAFEHELDLLIETMQQAGKREKGEHALCYMDMDQFKLVNDSAGHAAGDQLLIELAQIFTKHTREEDVVARMGGDEFAILMRNCSLDKAKHVAERLCEAVHQFRFIYDGRNFATGISIGLVQLDAREETVEEWLKAADSACFTAKDMGRNQVQIFDKGDDDTRKRKQEMNWAVRITEALEQNLFELYAQTILPLDTSKAAKYHFEILLRLRDEQGQWLSPGLFLPAAERYDKIVDIDIWVINAVFTWFANHSYYLGMLGKCTINLSGKSLGNERVIGCIEKNLERHPLKPEQVCFEITETSAISHLDSALNMMHRLRAHGCKIALDDFGCGMSSLSYLKDLPLDYIKIDGSFIRALNEEAINRSIVSAVHQIACDMGLQTVAEFVSDDQILASVEAIGIDYAQGFGIAEPMMLDAIFSTDTSQSCSQRTS